MCGLYCLSGIQGFLYRFRQYSGGNALPLFGISCRLSLLPAFANSAKSILALAGISVNPAVLTKGHCDLRKPQIGNPNTCPFANLAHTYLPGSGQFRNSARSKFLGVEVLV